MKIKIAAVVFLLMSVSLFSQIEEFDTLLKNNVTKEGVVDYKKILKNTEKLDIYINYLVKTSPEVSWSDDQKKAFWMNAYNAYTIQIILENYPLSSILKINSKGKDAWHQDFAIVGGKKYTLNEIEHEILRKEFSDPRIHVGVNCASFSCPRLLNEAYEANKLDSQLVLQTKNFINDNNKNEIEADEIRISSIFKWFKDDFTNNGTIQEFIQPFSERDFTRSAKVKYLDYNWSLNGK